MNNNVGLNFENFIKDHVIYFFFRQDPSFPRYMFNDEIIVIKAFPCLILNSWKEKNVLLRVVT